MSCVERDKSYISLKCKHKYLLMVIWKIIVINFFFPHVQTWSPVVSSSKKMQAAGESDVHSGMSRFENRCKQVLKWHYLLSIAHYLSINTE